MSKGIAEDIPAVPFNMFGDAPTPGYTLFIARIGTLPTSFGNPNGSKVSLPRRREIENGQIPA